MKKNRSKMPVIIPNQDSFQNNNWWSNKSEQLEESRKNDHYQKELAKRRK